MEVRTELIQELREKFFKKLDDEGPPDAKGFHPADVARIINNDDWLKRFLEHNECAMQESLNMLWESCTWRKKFGTNDLTEENVRRDYLEEGFCFAHGKDKDGKLLFIIKSKLYVKKAKDFLDVQKCIVYWFERLERQSNGNQISLFFDMAEAGLANMDMDLTKYLIGLFKTYYPNFLNNILVFEMPWVLNAAFNLIKSWLPPKAVPKIKFVNKSNLKEYVDPSEALLCWGGNNEYTFTFVPETRSETDTTMNGNLANKKVHFAEGSPMSDQSPTGFGDQSNGEHLLSVEPEAITFNKTENDVAGTITLKNTTTDKPLSYKIKTTSPEKFRVRPASGILQPQEKRVITVVLQPGYSVRKFFSHDRFLVMCLPLKNPNTTSQELAELWKSGKAAEEHRLVCYDGGVEKTEAQRSQSALYSSISNSERSSDTALLSKISHLETMITEMRHDVTTIKYSVWLLITLVVLISMFGIYVLLFDTNLKHASIFDDQLACHM